MIYLFLKLVFTFTTMLLRRLFQRDEENLKLASWEEGDCALWTAKPFGMSAEGLIYARGLKVFSYCRVSSNYESGPDYKTRDKRLSVPQSGEFPLNFLSRNQRAYCLSKKLINNEKERADTIVSYLTKNWQMFSNSWYLHLDSEVRRLNYLFKLL